jgi:DNA-binding NarL/FixJ family response regulator
MDIASTVSAEPISILIAEDFAPLRATLRQIIDQHPEFQFVGEASDGSAAIDLVLTLGPEVVIMDVHMPRLGGIEATRHIKRMLPAVHIIGLSFKDDIQTQEAMKSAGSSAFLSKNCVHLLPRLIASVTGKSMPSEEFP